MNRDSHSFLKVFLRVNNRKKRFTAADVIKANYPMVDYQGTHWKELHVLCKSVFKDGQGLQTYVWFGNLFFFLTEEDAKLFKTLPYLL